ncbi:MAG: hypothetical protein HY770_08750 [Chitinivibrionia bacterium]|nr:hypothetical protein [Chitinivibrionia bacterium]
MAENYYELILDGDEKVARAYLEGFLKGKNIRSGVLFCKDHHICSEHHVLGINFTHGHTHVICLAGIRAAIRSALKRVPDELPLKLASERAIRAIVFPFKFNTFTRDIGVTLKRMFHNPPKGVMIGDFEEHEEIDPDARGVEQYAPLHDFRYHGSGTVTGNVEQVLFFHKKMKEAEFVDVGDVRLEF